MRLIVSLIVLLIVVAVFDRLFAAVLKDAEIANEGINQLVNAFAVNRLVKVGT